MPNDLPINSIASRLSEVQTLSCKVLKSEFPRIEQACNKFEINKNQFITLCINEFLERNDIPPINYCLNNEFKTEFTQRLDEKLVNLKDTDKKLFSFTIINYLSQLHLYPEKTNLELLQLAYPELNKIEITRLNTILSTYKESFMELSKNILLNYENEAMIEFNKNIIKGEM